ncbi:HD domain-containing protein [Bacillus sp. DJP31]|uniref:HD domain-containing protein n=1 Tax=Bacillus sp. DJP31 TaxID=3409789 RepID=UPI003BB6937F
MAHAISVAYHAFKLAEEYNVHPDLAAKAGYLHDIGHFEWYSNGEWDYQLYRDYEIYPIKGAERAHKLLVRLGEDKQVATEIAHAILFHTDSTLPSGNFELSLLQKGIHLADEMDKQQSNLHHYRNIDEQKESLLIEQLDQKIEKMQYVGM